MSETPIMDFDVDILISKEENVTQEHTNVGNNGVIELNNTLNRDSDVTLLITPVDNVTSIKVKNTTLGSQFTVSGSMNIGTEVLIKDYLAYIDTVEVPVVFTAPFYIKENASNVLIFEITPTSAKINVQAIWRKASGTTKTQAYVEEFTARKARTVAKHRKRSGITNPVAVQDENYSFVLRALWVDSEYYDLISDNSSFFRIVYDTNSGITDINQQLYCLCGCAFDEFNIEQREGSLIKVSLSGTASNMYKE